MCFKAQHDKSFSQMHHKIINHHLSDVLLSGLQINMLKWKLQAFQIICKEITESEDAPFTLICIRV